jgi:organic radical activating enzyme
VTTIEQKPWYTTTPLNPDRNVSRKDYLHLKPDELLIFKHFPTLQGEGPESGKPCTFLRTAGCNRGGKGTDGSGAGLGCCFGTSCDTKFEYDQGQVMSFEKLVSGITEAWVSSRRALMETLALPIQDCAKTIRGSEEPPLVVITGGEPFLQPALPAFLTHLFELRCGAWQTKKAESWAAQIESNGDLLRNNDQCRALQQTDTILVISPKATSVAPGQFGYKELSTEAKASVHYLKFLIEDNPASPYYDLPSYAVSLLSDPNSWLGKGYQNLREILLSPIACYQRNTEPGEVASIWVPGQIDLETTGRNYTRAGQLALVYRNVRVSTQQHLTYNLP